MFPSSLGVIRNAMGRYTRLLKAAPLALLGLFGFASSSRPAFAAEPFDNDELVAGPEFRGFPDKDSHSGVFNDIIATGSNSLVQSALYRIVVPASQTSLRVAIFDANSAGLWDQNANIGDGVNVPPDGSVLGYDLAANGPSAPPYPATLTPFALGDSETPTPRPGAKIFTNAVDGRWEFLYDGPHVAEALTTTGSYEYLLTVKYLVPTSTAINGFKVAANGLVASAARGGNLHIGGFIGGVVDSRNLNFSGGIGERSVSRDHYPDLVKQRNPNLAAYNALLADGAARLPVNRWGGSSDPFVNKYNGTFDIRVRLIPPPGTTWVDYVQNLIIAEGDADDIDDLTGVDPVGGPSPINPGIPPDDGGHYIDLNGISHDNADYALPFDPASPTYPGRQAGSAYLELIDPTGAVRAVLTDLSGNVAQEDGTAASYERIPLPLDGIPGDWTFRMHQLDARNSWFLASTAEFITVDQKLCGRVYCDEKCDGINDTTDPGIFPVNVTVHRTDAAQLDVIVPTDANGNWCVDPIPVGTYQVSVTPGQPALAGKSPKTVQPITRTIVSGVNVTDADLGYCKEICDCDTDRRLHEVTFQSSVWMADPYTKDFNVYVRLDRAGAGCCQGDIQDLADFSYSGAFPGPQTGRNGLLKVTNVEVVNGYAKVTVVVTANAPQLPGGFFDGAFRIETTVNCVGEAACGKIDCDSIKIGGTFPSNWKPLWCGDVPDFFIVAKLAYTCWPDKPCTDGCVKGKSWWATVNKYGKCDATRIAWPVPADEDTSKICGKSWLSILQQPARCDTWVALAQQYVTARLNRYAGACGPVVVETALREAITLLEANCETRQLCGLDEERGWRLAKILEAYNLGLVGPKKCDVVIPKCPCLPPPPPPCKPPTKPPCDPKDPPKCDDKPKDDCDKDKPKNDCDKDKRKNDCDKDKSKNDCDKDKSKNDCDKDKSKNDCDKDKSKNDCDKDKSKNDCDKDKSKNDCDKDKSRCAPKS